MGPVEDMELPCTEGERRLASPCGFESCESGRWSPSEQFEYCNGHDDDCDGVTDEQPQTQRTTCCTDMRCMELQYCEDGACTELPAGQCILSGDCAEDHICEDQRCTPIFIPSDNASSCAQPVNLRRGSNTTVTGDYSNNQRPRSLSGCRFNDEIGNSEGYEVIYYLDHRLNLSSTYSLRASVSVNEVDIPISLSVTEVCPGTDRNVLSCFNNYRLNTSPSEVRTTMLLENGREYYFVIDTIGSTLQDEMNRQRVGFSEVSYQLAITL